MHMGQDVNPARNTRRYDHYQFVDGTGYWSDCPSFVEECEDTEGT